VSDHGARTTAAVQQRLLHASPDASEKILWLEHRAMVLGALDAVPRKALPKNLGALGIMIEAAELFATALYFSRGTAEAKGFVGKGRDELAEWLQRCRSLFQRYDEVYDELPPPKPKSGEPRKVAAAYGAIVNNMLRQIIEHGDIGDAADDDADEADREVSDLASSMVAVPGQALKELATALGSIMCSWMDPTHVDALMERVYAGHLALCQCRPLVTAADPENARGNA
jgi:hypothetical protein